MNPITIQNRLIGNGHLILENRRKGRTLAGANARIILRVRNEARAAGFSQSAINDFEMEGERGVHGLIAPAVEAVFKGEQDFSWPFPFRMYDIRGDHPQNNSTVGVMTLVHEWILPRDLNIAEIVFHYANEFSFLTYCEVLTKIEDAKKFFKGGK